MFSDNGAGEETQGYGYLLSDLIKLNERAYENLVEKRDDVYASVDISEFKYWCRDACSLLSLNLPDKNDRFNLF
jgi:hypothetical protein